jgi:pilus assembly protein CpaE
MQKLSALVVDPNLDSRLDTVKAVAHADIDTVGEAAYGTEATFLAVDRKPDIVLLALEDPPVRGLATLEAMQRQLPGLPVIAYSSSATPLLLRQAMRAGAGDFIEKPLMTRDLREAIQAVLAQAEVRRGIREPGDEQSRATGTTVTIAGAKGGIGKTTIATNLALALRIATGQDVSLLDADVQFGDVGVMLDLEGNARQSVGQIARQGSEITRHSLSEYILRHETGIDVLTAGNDVDDWSTVRPEHVLAIARSLAETHEYVLIDSPGTLNEIVAAALREAAVVLLVTSLDISSVKDTKTAARILESWAIPTERIRLVVNDNTRASTVRPEDVIEATGLEVARYLPHDPQVGLSVQAGRPIVLSHPQSAFARAVVGLAESIAGMTESGGPRRSIVRLPLLGRRGR